MTEDGKNIITAARSKRSFIFMGLSIRKSGTLVRRRSGGLIYTSKTRGLRIERAYTSGTLHNGDTCWIEELY